MGAAAPEPSRRGRTGPATVGGCGGTTPHAPARQPGGGSPTLGLGDESGVSGPLHTGRVSKPWSRCDVVPSTRLSVPRTWDCGSPSQVCMEAARAGSRHMVRAVTGNGRVSPDTGTGRKAWICWSLGHLAGQGHSQQAARGSSRTQGDIGVLFPRPADRGPCWGAWAAPLPPRVPSPAAAPWAVGSGRVTLGPEATAKVRAGCSCSPRRGWTPRGTGRLCRPGRRAQGSTSQTWTRRVVAGVGSPTVSGSQHQDSPSCGQPAPAGRLDSRGWELGLAKLQGGRGLHLWKGRPAPQSCGGLPAGQPAPSGTRGSSAWTAATRGEAPIVSLRK